MNSDSLREASVNPSSNFLSKRGELILGGLSLAI